MDALGASWQTLSQKTSTRQSRRRQRSPSSDSSSTSSSSRSERRPAKKCKRSNSDVRRQDSPGKADDAENLLKAHSNDQPASGIAAGDSPCAPAHDALLNDIANEFDNEDDSISTPVSSQLADIVNKRWSEKMTDKKLKEKYEKYGRPSNCKKLTVPKVNPEIWGQISHVKKQQDLRLANVQNAIVKAGFALTNSVEAMLKARQQNGATNLDEFVVAVTNALALLGRANVDLSLRRREFLRPCLNQEYSTLCSTQHPVTTLLFGDDLPSQLANIKTTNRIAQSVDGSHSRRHIKAPYDKRSARQQSHYGGPDNNHIMAGRNFYTQAGGQITPTTDIKRTKEKTEEAGNRSEQRKRFSRTSNL